MRRGRGRSARGAGRRSLVGIDRSASSAMVWGRAGTLVAVAQIPRLSGHTGSRVLGVVRWLSPVAGFRTHASVSTATRTRVDDALMSASAFSPRLSPLFQPLLCSPSLVLRRTQNSASYNVTLHPITSHYIALYRIASQCIFSCFVRTRPSLPVLLGRALLRACAVCPRTVSRQGMLRTRSPKSPKSPAAPALERAQTTPT